MAMHSARSGGRRLREARVELGISLEEVSGITKISLKALEAIERNDISKIPGGIFGRAYVRSYASAICLDPDEVVRDFVIEFSEFSIGMRNPPVRQAEAFVREHSDAKRYADRRRRVHAVLDLWSALLPARVANEDLADYREDINRRLSARQRPLIYLRLVTAILWTAFNAVGYAMTMLGKQKAR